MSQRRTHLDKIRGPKLRTWTQTSPVASALPSSRWTWCSLTGKQTHFLGEDNLISLQFFTCARVFSKRKHDICRRITCKSCKQLGHQQQLHCTRASELCTVKFHKVSTKEATQAHTNMKQHKTLQKPYSTWSFHLFQQLQTPDPACVA